MKRNALFGLFVLLLVSLSIVMASTGANATMLTADCDGWTSSGSFTMPTDLEFTIYLYQDSELIWSYTETANVTFEDPYFLFTGEWPMELCGDYTAHLDLKYNMGAGWRLLTYDTDFTCECGYDFCTWTPGYWKNHEEAWPVEALTVGCVDYTKAELLDIFDWSTKDGNVSIKLFHHLVAAKLNVLTGADDYIMGSIMAGDDFFCAYPLHRAYSDGPKGDAVAIKDDLVAYNEIECEEEEDKDEMLTIDGPAAMENSAATKDATWGSIKKKME
jgi:hypothetical protein